MRPRGGRCAGGMRREGPHPAMKGRPEGRDHREERRGAGREGGGSANPEVLAGREAPRPEESFRSGRRPAICSRCGVTPGDGQCPKARMCRTPSAAVGEHGAEVGHGSSSLRYPSFGMQASVVGLPGLAASEPRSLPAGSCRARRASGTHRLGSGLQMSDVRERFRSIHKNNTGVILRRPFAPITGS
jgi:hypothetical protein